MSSTPRPATEEPTMLDRLLTFHTQGAAAALAAQVTLTRATAEKQRRFDTHGLPRLTAGAAR